MYYERSSSITIVIVFRTRGLSSFVHTIIIYIACDPQSLDFNLPVNIILLKLDSLHD